MSVPKGNIGGVLLAASLLVMPAVIVLTDRASGAEVDASQERPIREAERQNDKQRMKEEFDSQFPITDFAAPEPNDPVEKAKRRARSDKHNNAKIPLEEEADTVVSVAHWAVRLPALPVAQSRVMVLGHVRSSNAYLSTDKTSVYSEFTVVIDEVLKNDIPEQLKPGSSIVVERDGGRVRFPSGSMTVMYTQGQGMPRQGRQYVLFLTRRDSESTFQILTGYELKAGRVELLDSPGGAAHPITQYKGTDQTTLLEAIRNALAGKNDN